MLYVLYTEKDYDGNETYILFETLSESSLMADKDRLKRLQLIHGIEIMNMRIIVPEKTSKTWWDKVRCEAAAVIKDKGYILLCKVNAATYKLVSHDRKVSYIDFNQLEIYMKEDKMANCSMHAYGLGTMSMYKADENRQLIESVAKQYKRYEAMSSVLGGPMSFKYIIEGDEVKLVRYTGSNKNVIVPKFVTSILTRAFYDTAIETVTLEPGLKAIGSQAFDSCNLAEVIIPESVEFIGVWAFNNNRRLTKADNSYKKERIVIPNKRTVIVDRYNNSLY